MRVDPRTSFHWHAFFLAVTTSFTEVNTVMPALVLSAGGNAATVGALTAVMIGLPLVAQLLFAGFLSTRTYKKPYLLLGINLRVLALAGGAIGIAVFGTRAGIIPSVFAAMTIFALSGAFAGVSYTSLLGSLISSSQRRRFFVRRQLATTIGLGLSAVATMLLLRTTDFPDGYVLLFALASGFLFIASAGFWPLREPRPDDVIFRSPNTTTPSKEPAPSDTPALSEASAPSDTPAPSDTSVPSDASVPSASRAPVNLFQALRQAPAILRNDPNLRVLIVVMNLLAVGFTSIPLLTALAHDHYDLTASTAGTFALIHIGGMMLASPLWSKVIHKGGYRLVLQSVLGLVIVAFPIALVLSQTAPVAAYSAIYLLTGAIAAGQKIAIDGAVVQISPDNSRALYAGLFGAANLASALLPLFAGSLVAQIGYPPVFAAAAVAAIAALWPLRRLQCGDWYRHS